jgi:hypothetical protein
MAKRQRRRRPAVGKLRLTLVRMGIARVDSSRFLNDAQQWEIEGHVDRLGSFGDHAETWDLDIEKIDREDNIHRLLVRGGIFGKKCAEVFFAPVTERSEIVVLGVKDGNPFVSPPPFRIEQMRSRLRHYRKIVH